MSQAKLAEKANASTHYIAMIELTRKFPTPEMLERIAAALEINANELFLTSSPTRDLKSFQNVVLAEIEEEVDRAIKEAVQRVIARHLVE
ncbi:conserved domain protein [Leadbettera azotonutricia ZAS-9]|uniref:Conserved domain protein n=1 Tax=Leadbettera azotonutricia (strain ATCC BAA-888 / DSM 13862 / ZAS-9) TaxID=545695 RepID=F5YGE8_LEAAZ|nr:conserved domain protein [Leadbettera azotonutricia ZAS-9]